MSLPSAPDRNSGVGHSQPPRPVICRGHICRHTTPPSKRGDKKVLGSSINNPMFPGYWVHSAVSRRGVGLFAAVPHDIIVWRGLNKITETPFPLQGSDGRG